MIEQQGGIEIAGIIRTEQDSITVANQLSWGLRRFRDPIEGTTATLRTFMEELRVLRSVTAARFYFMHVPPSQDQLAFVIDILARSTRRRVPPQAAIRTDIAIDKVRGFFHPGLEVRGQIIYDDLGREEWTLLEQFTGRATKEKRKFSGVIQFARGKKKLAP